MACSNILKDFENASLRLKDLLLKILRLTERYLLKSDKLLVCPRKFMAVKLIKGIEITASLESPYHLAAVSGAHFTQGTILIVILVSSGSAKSRTHQSAVGGFLVTRRGWPGRLRACRIWTFINSV